MNFVSIFFLYINRIYSKKDSAIKNEIINPTELKNNYVLASNKHGNSLGFLSHDDILFIDSITIYESDMPDFSACRSRKYTAVEKFINKPENYAEIQKLSQALVSNDWDYTAIDASSIADESLGKKFRKISSQKIPPRFIVSDLVSLLAFNRFYIDLCKTAKKKYTKFEIKMISIDEETIVGYSNSVFRIKRNCYEYKGTSKSGIICIFVLICLITVFLISLYNKQYEESIINFE